MEVREITLRRVIPIVVSQDTGPITAPADVDGVMVSLYEAHKKIYPRSVSGLFSNWRWGVVLLTQLVFYGLPWLEWGWLERKTEGDRSGRMRRDAGPWTGDKVLRKVSKHMLWLAMALWTGCQD